jgi:hypothetical protein
MLSISLGVLKNTISPLRGHPLYNAASREDPSVAHLAVEIWTWTWWLGAWWLVGRRCSSTVGIVS